MKMTLKNSVLAAAVVISSLLLTVGHTSGLMPIKKVQTFTYAYTIIGSSVQGETDPDIVVQAVNAKGEVEQTQTVTIEGQSAYTARKTLYFTPKSDVPLVRFEVYIKNWAAMNPLPSPSCKAFIDSKHPTALNLNTTFSIQRKGAFNSQSAMVCSNT